MITYSNVLAGVSYRSWYVWRRNVDTYLRLWKTELWPPFVEPIMYLLAFGLGLGLYITNIGSQSYLAFIAPGILAQSGMFAATFECTYGSYFRMEYQKTFDAIIATPASIQDVVTGEILWGMSRGLFSAFAILVVIGFMGLAQWPSSLLALPLSVLAGLMFGAIAMVVTAVAPSVNAFNYYFTLGITPMFLVSGVFFPLDQLPPIIQQFTGLSPLTHVVLPVRAVVSGQLYAGMLIDIAIVIVITVIAFYFALLLMSRRLIK